MKIVREVKTVYSAETFPILLISFHTEAAGIRDREVQAVRIGILPVTGCDEERALILKKGTIVDSTLIAAPSSTKNQKKKRDPEAHDTYGIP